MYHQKNIYENYFQNFKIKIQNIYVGPTRNKFLRPLHIAYGDTIVTIGGQNYNFIFVLPKMITFLFSLSQSR